MTIALFKHFVIPNQLYQLNKQSISFTDFSFTELSVRLKIELMSRDETDELRIILICLLAQRFSINVTLI